MAKKIKDISIFKNGKWSPPIDIGVKGENVETKEGSLYDSLNMKADKATTLSGYGISDAYTKTEVTQVINNANHLKKKVVDSLPLKGDNHIIYLVKKNGNNEHYQNVYNEYIWVGEKFEIIGDTRVDLADYAKKADLPTRESLKINNVDNTHDGDKKVKYAEVAGEVIISAEVKNLYKKLGSEE